MTSRCSSLASQNPSVGSTEVFPRESSRFPTGPFPGEAGAALVSGGQAALGIKAPSHTALLPPSASQDSPSIYISNVLPLHCPGPRQKTFGSEESSKQGTGEKNQVSRLRTVTEKNEPEEGRELSYLYLHHASRK